MTGTILTGAIMTLRLQATMNKVQQDELGLGGTGEKAMSEKLCVKYSSVIYVTFMLYLY